MTPFTSPILDLIRFFCGVPAVGFEWLEYTIAISITISLFGLFIYFCSLPIRLMFGKGKI
jgi:hypothetical protein